MRPRDTTDNQDPFHLQDSSYMIMGNKLDFSNLEFNEILFHTILQYSCNPDGCLTGCCLFMSSTALSHLPPALQTPLFFRLDLRSQRLVALTDVMQTPLYWLDEPRAPGLPSCPMPCACPSNNCWPTAMAARSPCALPASSGISPSPTSRMASGSSVCRTFARSPSPTWHCNCRASARWRASNSMRPCSRPLKRVWGPIGSSSGTIRPTAISAASNSPRCSPWGSRRSTPFVVTAAISAPCVPANR